ncbi:MAG: T9SS type A sorting domain-containing protein [Bacteroidota bacterium]
MKILHLLFALLLATPGAFAATPDFPQVPYGPEARQYCDIYIAPSTCPTPVFFNAHSNGGNTSLPNAITDSLKANGISIVSWESLTSINTPLEVDTGWNDAELMFAWVKANAATYNFDTTNFIIGGSSRGTILSWKYGHRADPNIKGLYMYNALPDGVWADSTWWYPPNEVKVTAPELFFVYRFAPGTNDIHDPNNGFMIMDRYNALGIGNRDTLIHSLEFTANNDRFQFLVEFALSVIDPCPMVGVEPAAADRPNWTAYPNPVRDRISVTNLRGDEHFVLTSVDGTRIAETDDLRQVDAAALRAGIYFLTVRNESARRVLKLVKY